MEVKAHHVLIGAFTLAALLLGAAMALWLGSTGAERSFDYDILFEEPVTGLGLGGAVEYNGIRVGQVHDLTLDPNDPSSVYVRVRVRGDVTLREDTKAELGYQGLTGVAYIQLTGVSATSPALISTQDDVPVIVADLSNLQALLDGGQGMIQSVNQVLERVESVLSEENTAQLSVTIEGLASFAQTLAEQREALERTLDNLALASDALPTVVAELDTTVKVIRELSENEGQTAVAAIETAAQRADELLTTLDAIASENRESIGSFANQGLPQITATVREAQQLIENLARLAERLDAEGAGLLLGERTDEFDPTQ